MASLRDLLPLVLPRVPGCSDLEALQALRLSAIDWCERTRCWRHQATQVLTVQGPTIATPSYGVVHEVEHAEFNGRQLEPVLWTDVTPEALDGGTAMARLTQSLPDAITLLPFEAGTLTLSLILKPRPAHEHSYAVAAGAVQDAYDQMPDEVLRHQGEALAWGALARLYVQPEAAWANPALAAHHEGKVDERAPLALSRALKGQQRAPLRTKTAWF